MSTTSSSIQTATGVDRLTAAAQSVASTLTGVRPEPITIRRAWLALEFALLFGLPPLLMYLRVIPLRALFAVLFIGAGLTMTYLLLNRSFRNRQLWFVGSLKRDLRITFQIFLIGAAGLAAYTVIAEPGNLLNLPLNRPSLWIMIMIFYPLVSVYPQEIIFRTFLFHRYRDLFRTDRALVVASAAAFGYAHFIFENSMFLSVALTLLGGLMFAWTYARTRSTLMAVIEHALYGCFIFTIGLGHHFYTGAVQG